MCHGNWICEQVVLRPSDKGGAPQAEGQEDHDDPWLLQDARYKGRESWPCSYRPPVSQASWIKLIYIIENSHSSVREVQLILRIMRRCSSSTGPWTPSPLKMEQEEPSLRFWAQCARRMVEPSTFWILRGISSSVEFYSSDYCTDFIIGKLMRRWWRLEWPRNAWPPEWWGMETGRTSSGLTMLADVMKGFIICSKVST